MEGISANNSAASNIASKRQSCSTVQTSNSLPTSLNSQGITHKISAISLLSQKASNSSDDVRADVMERARQFLDDPNWPNDEHLSNLANKIIDEENL